MQTVSKHGIPAPLRHVEKEGKAAVISPVPFRKKLEKSLPDEKPSRRLAGQYC
jgi:hypothetical protein